MICVFFRIKAIGERNNFWVVGFHRISKKQEHTHKYCMTWCATGSGGLLMRNSGRWTSSSAHIFFEFRESKPDGKPSATDLHVPGTNLHHWPHAPHETSQVWGLCQPTLLASIGCPVVCLVNRFRWQKPEAQRHKHLLLRVSLVTSYWNLP